MASPRLVVCTKVHVRVRTHTQHQPARTMLTHTCPVYVPLVQCSQWKKAQVSGWGHRGEARLWPHRGLLFVQPVPPHLSPAGLFSLLPAGGEVPFEAL